MLIIVIAVLLILFFQLWAIVRLPDWEKEKEDREQEEYLKKWIEEHGK